MGRKVKKYRVQVLDENLGGWDETLPPFGTLAQAQAAVEWAKQLTLAHCHQGFQFRIEEVEVDE